MSNNQSALIPGLLKRMQTAAEEFRSDVPTLSLAERDRRYGEVRRRMSSLGVDCLVVRADSSKWDAGSGEGRYLSHIGGNGEEGYLVFDVKQDPVFIIWGPDHIPYWRQAQAWVEDLRPMRPTAAAAVVARIKELAHERGRIGLVGRLGSRLWRGEGRWPHTNLEMLRSDLPHAEFVDFDEELWAVMAVKSDEEIACIGRAMQAVEAGIEAMYASAIPGARSQQVVARILEGLVGAGSELSAQILFASGKRAGRVAARVFAHRVLEKGDLVINEIAGKYCGYWAQGHAPVSVGQSPDPASRRIFEASLTALHAGMQALRPGITGQELAEVVRRPILDAGYELNVMPLFKGIGLTIAEAPYSPTGVGLDAQGQSPRYEIRQGEVLFFEPAAWDPSLNRCVHIGEQVVVTANGCRRLGTRPLELKVS